MGKVLQIRVYAYTYDEKEVRKSWPRLWSLAFETFKPGFPVKRPGCWSLSGPWMTCISSGTCRRPHGQCSPPGFSGGGGDGGAGAAPCRLEPPSRQPSHRPDRGRACRAGEASAQTMTEQKHMRRPHGR